MDDTRRIPADSALPGWLASLPPGWQPYAMLARWDRPVGIWLLYLPCLIGLMFQRLITGVYIMDLVWAVLFLLGALIMVYNVYRTIRGDVRQGEKLDAAPAGSGQIIATPAE